MRIGIDLDDTICRTTEIVHDRVEKYAASENLNALDVMNDEVLKEGFFRIYLEDIYSNVEIKHEVANVLKRIRNRGNEIYIITARSSNFVPTVKNVRIITEEWLKKHDIEVDDREKYELKDDYVTNWLQVEKYIERNRKNEKSNK